MVCCVFFFKNLVLAELLQQIENEKRMKESLLKNPRITTWKTSRMSERDD